MTSHMTSTSILTSSLSTFWNCIIFILSLIFFILTFLLASINQSFFIQLYLYHFHVLKQSRYKAWKSDYEAKRSNPMQDFYNITNCNNMTLEVKSSSSGSFITTIIQNFILLSLISLPSRVSTWSHSFFSSYALNSLYAQLFIIYICVPARKTFCLSIYLKLSTYEDMQLLSSIITVSDEEVVLLVGRN